MQTQLSFYKQTSKEYLDNARFAAKKLLRDKTFVTTDDIWKACPPPKLLNPKIMGNVFQDSIFESIGWKHTERLTSHHRRIQMYRMRKEYSFED